MQKTPVITVIIPVFNAEKTIIRALNSVLNQEFHTEYQIIIINDGSTDKSLQIIKNYISSNNILNVEIINKPNEGVSSARNAGLKIAKGKYIAFLDSDDYWKPEKIKKQVSILEVDNSIYLIGCNFEQLNYATTKHHQEISIKELIFKNYFQPSTVVIRSDVIKKMGYFDETIKYAEEGNYFQRICYKYKCVFLNEYLIEYGSGKTSYCETGLASNLFEMEKGELRNLYIALKNKYIKLHIYVVAFIYSIVKFIRRFIIVKTRRHD